MVGSANLIYVLLAGLGVVGFGETQYMKHRGGRTYTYAKEYAYFYYDDKGLNGVLEVLQRIGYKPAAYRDKTWYKGESTSKHRRKLERNNPVFKTYPTNHHTQQKCVSRKIPVHTPSVHHSLKNAAICRPA